MDTTLFKTELGYCAIAWNPSGVTRVWLPEKTKAAIKIRMKSSLIATKGKLLAADAAPAWIRTAIKRITKHLAGGRVDRLSGAKTAALKDLAAKAAAGLVPTRRQILKMDNEAIIEQLTAIRGIGRWTVEMMLMFSLGRPDVFPDTDYGVRKGFALVFGLKELPKPKEMAAHAERWKPHRSAAAWYFWRALDDQFKASQPK